jgi:hypothetical protein
MFSKVVLHIQQHIKIFKRLKLYHSSTMIQQVQDINKLHWLLF